jgi:hypothetical protein
MNKTTQWLPLLTGVLGVLAQAQDAAPADPHAGHVMPAAPAVDHSQHQMPATTQTAPHSTLPAGVRDPHAYANGYVVGSGAYSLPGGHAAHMGSHVYSGGLLINQLETMDTPQGQASHV